jgi:D-tyrosyl-tRNA(Tyr) deacylase
VNVRAVIQRVTSADVSVAGRVVGRIDAGLLVLLGVEKDDGAADVAYVAAKIRDVRVFPDDDGRMNRSLVDAGGSALVVSQFTLCGDVRKGRRPSFDAAAPPADAYRLYADVVALLRADGLNVETGEFQAMMAVSLVNDGPVTLLIDSRRRF